MIIEKIISDCDCIKVKYPNNSIKPGNKGSFEVEFNSSGLHGKQLKTIEIHANTKELKHLAIFATVKNEELNFKY